MQQSKVYFKGLNGLRFFAAFLVLMQHAESIRQKYSLFHLADYTFFFSGSLAVEFFFVLSGFLITYLLLEEDANTGTIDIKNFYMRRVLRIWPLYYLILIIGMLIIPVVIKLLHIEYTAHYPFVTAGLLYVFFLPNLVISIWGSSFLAPLWSIGVEEQFYFFWAPLVKYFKKYAIGIFFTIIGLRLVFYAYYHHYNHTHTTPSVALDFINTLKFEAMSIGGLGAWLFYHFRERMMRTSIFSVSAQIALLGIIILRFTCHKYLTNEDTTLLGTIYTVIFGSFYSLLFTNALFLWLILNISSNPKSILTTDNKVLNFLGNISYGIYMYHGIVLFVTIIFMKNILRTLPPVAATIAMYTVSGGLTILTAYISYRFIESKFLKLKKRFEPKAANAKPVEQPAVQIAQ
ncbi:acyltransferase family protein [Chitinophaga rhizophila]|uniref:Acyltransferase n=1 Tax=Chitinophaga rhizophila TaxID=2866212 RepID=A0ABS7GLY1_9BACT|nr:acyltransferase [Chitinophaga rhizophila]MBW8687752.1 acyltransferase [Chitinophaga rhizophila]